MPFNAEATVSPTRSAVCAALAAERPPTRSSRRSNARKRCSNSPISAEIAREYSDRENMLSPRADACGRVVLVNSRFDLALGFVLRHAVALLKPAAELHALALDDVEVVAGELAPLLLNLAFELLPIAFDTIPIHRFAPLSLSLCLLRSCRRNVQPENPARQQKFRRAVRANSVLFRKRRGRSRPLCRLRPS